MNRRTIVAGILSPVLTLVACLPAETRPEPGRVYVTASLHSELRDNAITDGHTTFDTEDGWTVTLDRLIVSMGNLRFASEDTCSEYASARYQRILDLQRPESQKVAQIWGLNDCLVAYSVRTPQDDSVLGAGVTDEERQLMANAVVPVSSPSGLTTAEGMALHIRGSAEKDAARVNFDWGFSDRLAWTDCKRSIHGSLEARLPLKGGETVNVNIAVDPRNLFRTNVSDGDSASKSDAGTPSSKSVWHMQQIADADWVTGNANGQIGIDELLAVATPGVGIEGSQNLAEALRTLAYPSMFIYSDNGQCVADTGGRHGPRGVD